MKAGKYLTVVVSIELLNNKLARHQRGEDWSAGVILDTGRGEEVDTEQAGRQGRYQRLSEQ